MNLLAAAATRHPQAAAGRRAVSVYNPSKLSQQDAAAIRQTIMGQSSLKCYLLCPAGGRNSPTKITSVSPPPVNF